MTSRRDFFRTAVAASAAAAFSAPLLDSFVFAGEPPRRWTTPPGAILLNSNENAYGPFPSVLALPNPFLDANRYPFSATTDFQDKLASKMNVSSEQLVVGCGSTEVLKLAVCALTSPTRPLIMAAPTFEAAEMHAKAIGTPVKHVPLTTSYAHDLEAMRAAAAPNGGLIYVCNPNNPTASLTPRRDIEALIANLPANTYVLIDEAYHDFVPTDADYKTFADTPEHDQRVIVARTFSKIYGIAGLRLGYAIAHPSLAPKLSEQSQMDSVNIFALRCATRALDDDAAHSIAARRNATDRTAFFAACKQRNIPAIPSATNFAMIETHRPVREVIAHFKQRNILVGRPFPPFLTHLRVSFGKPDEMQAFWRVWDELPAVAAS